MQSMNLELDEDQSHSTSFTSKNIFEKYIFPIVAEANRVKRVPNIVRLIEFFYIFVQIAFVGFDDVIPDTNIDNSYRIILNIVFFGFVGPADTHIPFFIALILIDFFTFLIFIGTIIDYHINHEYRKSLISILRIWHGHLFGIFLIPNILMIASNLSYLGSNFNAFGFLILIFSAIFGVYSIWHCLVLLSFFSRSPYLTPCPVQAWNIKNVYIVIVLFSIPIAIAKFLSFDFDDWFDFIPIILGLIVCIIGCIFCLYFPFKGVGYNALCYLALGNSIGSSIMMILLVGTDLDIPDLVFYGISIGVGIVLSIVMYFVLLNKQRKIVKQLNYASFWDNDEVKPTEDAKREHFSAFNFSSPLTRLLYVQIGFEFMCDLSVDWALERYLSEQYPEDDALLVFMCWIVSLFPSEIHFLHNLITLEGKIPVRSLNEKCMIFQVHRIHIFRQSSASREASTDFAKVNQLTTNAINAFCKFWANVANPNVEFDEKIYTQLSNQQHQADAAWSEALDKYPNNSRFQNEYSRYLCDCCCAFKKSIIIHQHAAQLDSGAKLINDRNFHHFVLTFPNYLKKGVVDV
ncbi:hypothetical protein TRFO_35417 [Tritrichomonas foetus]|uniref:Uncharacterized protein n=1 Tax=Tritrichomonas foetus TaxID=1144522 RepID=A0A1J4JGE8_9EUKA|nr:hypothetical protein TRFO_35417 [Tritrichomonas foetus]|eukprot:OHS98218.1 hypothetical protein TRFO_35417 [Tritrichomonas foetus]